MIFKFLKIFFSCQDELERTGVNMPQFKKLGGMLYDGEAAGDRRCLNGGARAVVSIEQHFAKLARVLQQRDADRLLDFLTDPLSKIHGVDGQNIRQYLVVFTSEAKGLTRDFTQVRFLTLVTQR